jgi:2-phospho-L-lactate guanylyltransferase
MSAGPVWALVPAKCFTRGKSRLSPVLDDTARAAFARRLLDHVLGTLLASESVAGVLVATDCDEVAEAARARSSPKGPRVAVRMDADPGPLNTVVDAALRDLATRGAGAALVLMADLPRITSEDVHALIEALDGHDMVLVTDVRGRHTNALGLRPPARIATCFGRPDSFAAHAAAAREAGLRLAVLENERIAFDVDGPSELARL